MPDYAAPIRKRKQPHLLWSTLVGILPQPLRRRGAWNPPPTPPKEGSLKSSPNPSKGGELGTDIVNEIDIVIAIDIVIDIVIDIDIDIDIEKFRSKSLACFLIHIPAILPHLP